MGQKTLDELGPGLLDDMKSIGLNGGPGNSLVFVWWEMRDTLLNAVASVGWGGRGLITLVGDVAHAMRPTDGDGGSMALEDALVLGRVIGSASTPLTTTSIPHLLRNFESERLPRVQKVWQNQFDR